jgi:hypothetical protein
VERAKALGLIWTLRPATVNTSYGAAPTVVYDGDTEQVGVTSLVGNLQASGRVMMLQVPPAGNFVIGRLSTTGATTVKQLCTFRGEVNATGDVTLTTASQAIIPLLTLDITSDAEYLITPNVDFDAFVAGGNNLVAATLQIDGVGLADQMIFQENTSGVRLVLSKTWHGTLLAGTHTFQMIAAKSLNTGGWATRSVGTSLVYQIFQ